jgi:hypothetical protein
MELIGAWLQEIVFKRRVAETVGCLYSDEITADVWLCGGRIEDLVA